jgi:glyoxylase-like metal-dependent hydrolase (beta-lactamase superfamily II)
MRHPRGAIQGGTGATWKRFWSSRRRCGDTPMTITHAVDQVTPDLTRIRYLFVNLYLRGEPGSRDWVLIDGALKGAEDVVLATAEERFGQGTKPAAILVTHGHFDHVGALPGLLERWGDVPILAHPLEIPHLTGKADYPPPDPTVGKGAMALMSFAYPNKAADFGERVRPLPEGGAVPPMPGWRWIHTPGHTAGHVSFFRERDRCLVAGDAFTTVKQESLYAVMTQEQEVHGPPAYFTPDWVSARRSVEALAALRPAIAATGHGTPMRGEELAKGLALLVEEFGKIAVPSQGRYVP